MTFFNPHPKPGRPILLNDKDRRELKVRLYHGRAKRSCEFCGKSVPLNYGKMDVFKHAHLVHIIPRKKGGDTEENCKIGCYECHMLDPKNNGHLAWRSDKKEDENGV